MSIDLADQGALPCGLPLLEIPTASAWCLRWRGRQHSWRHPEDGGFSPAHYEVHPVGETAAKAYVVANHYSGSYPAAINRFGLFDVTRDTPHLAGVAVFGVPVRASVLSNAFPGLEPFRASQELSRFVLDDECPGNSESWFLARCFSELLAQGVRGVVSHADPVPRVTADGRRITVGHVGRIYQASNAAYCGRATPRTLILLPDGRVLSDRSAQKVRRQERGHEYVERMLTGMGASVPRAGQDPAAWLRQALEDLGARRLRHRGVHRYLFQLGRNRRERERVRLGLPAMELFPKLPDAA